MRFGRSRKRADLFAAESKQEKIHLNFGEEQRSFEFSNEEQVIVFRALSLSLESTCTYLATTISSFTLQSQDRVLREFSIDICPRNKVYPTRNSIKLPYQTQYIHKTCLVECRELLSYKKNIYQELGSMTFTVQPLTRI